MLLENITTGGKYIHLGKITVIGEAQSGFMPVNIRNFKPVTKTGICVSNVHFMRALYILLTMQQWLLFH